MTKRKRAETQKEIDDSTTFEKVKKAESQRSRNVRDSIRSISKNEVHHFDVAFLGKGIICERRGAPGAKPELIFTHGAGGGLSTPATAEFTDGFAQISPIVSFKGSMNLQSRVKCFQAVYQHEGVSCALGGRSMGARSAAMVAQRAELNVKALVLVSFPMVGAQKGDSREQILLDLSEGVDVLFVSGSIDSMCELGHLKRVMGQMNANSWMVEVKGTDHGMNLGSEAGTQALRARTGSIAAEWLIDRDLSKTHCSLTWDEQDGKVVSTGWQEPQDEDLKDIGTTSKDRTRKRKKRW